MLPRALFLLLTFGLAVSAQGTAKPASVATVTYLVGTVELKRDGTSLPARVSMACRSGDTLVSSKASRLELRYPDNTLLRLDENSRLVLTARSPGKPEPTLLVGKTWANVKRIGQGGTGFGVRTPTAVAAVRGTVFGVSGTDTGSAVRLYEGKVDAASTRSDSLARVRGDKAGPKEISLEDWVHLLRGEEVSFRRDGTWSRAKFDIQLDLDDPWVKFNADRDSTNGRPWTNQTDSDNPWAN
jgi:hypothetical protein